MAIVLAVSIWTAVIYDLFDHRVSYPAQFNAAENIGTMALLIGMAGFALSVVTIGADLLNPDKAVILARFNRWGVLWQNGAAIAAVCSFAYRKWYVFSMAMLLLVFDVFVGIRVNFALTFIALLLIVMEGRGRQRLLFREYKPAMIALLGATFLFLYKSVYEPIKAGDWGQVVFRLSHSNYYIYSITQSEPFITQTILNEVLEQKFHVGFDHFSSILLQFVLFAPSLGATPVSFNDLFQSALFPWAIDWGMANNIWAEMWSSGGWWMLIAFAQIYALILVFLSRMMRVDNPAVRAMIALFAALWAFYIHRNDLFVQVNMSKRVILIGGIATLAALFFWDVTHRFRRLRRSVRAIEGSRT